MGRFLQREPGPTDLNSYRYVNNNPASWVDPLGTNLLSPPISQGLILSGIEGSAGMGTRSPPISIDIPIASPEGLSDVLPPLWNPPSGPDLLPPPSIGTPAHDTCVKNNTCGQLGILKAEAGGKSKEANAEKQRERQPPTPKKGSVRWDEKRGRWVDDAGVYTWDEAPHEKRGSGPHWDFGSWDGRQKEWSPDGINWFQK